MKFAYGKNTKVAKHSVLLRGHLRRHEPDKAAEVAEASGMTRLALEIQRRKIGDAKEVGRLMAKVDGHDTAVTELINRRSYSWAMTFAIKGDLHLRVDDVVSSAMAHSHNLDYSKELMFLLLRAVEHMDEVQRNPFKRGTSHTFGAESSIWEKRSSEYARLALEIGRIGTKHFTRVNDPVSVKSISIFVHALTTNPLDRRIGWSGLHK